MYREHTLHKDINNLIEEVSSAKIAKTLIDVSKKRIKAGKSLIPYNPLLMVPVNKIIK